MGQQVRPRNVYQAVTAQLNSRVLPKYQVQEPPWYKAMYWIPPSEILTRPVPIRHRKPDPNLTRPRNTFKPQTLSFPEDGLRRVFYKDHPWELARPRMILELDGKDSRHVDWSKGLRQPGMPLSGEWSVIVAPFAAFMYTNLAHSVVQRQLWLMENEGMRRNEAYDKARHEFYALRQEEEIERRIAKEEARYVGAYFGKSRLDIGMELEDREFENWKHWATAEIARVDALRNTEISFSTEDAAVEDEDTLDEPAAEAAKV
jgi:small subunit ribosomal protein S23